MTLVQKRIHFTCFRYNRKNLSFYGTISKLNLFQNLTVDDINSSVDFISNVLLRLFNKLFNLTRFFITQNDSKSRKIGVYFRDHKCYKWLLFLMKFYHILKRKIANDVWVHNNKIIRFDGCLFVEEFFGKFDWTCSSQGFVFNRAFYCNFVFLSSKLNKVFNFLSLKTYSQNDSFDPYWNQLLNLTL